MRSRLVVAIDGPAGAGKSTVARKLADRLGYVLVDTGALYRGVALAAQERGVSWDDGPGLGAVGRALRLHFSASSEGPRLHIDGADRSGDLRTPHISLGASAVSRHPEVREALLGWQRTLGADGGVVLEGRDIGTVVFPDAEAKFFLTASPEVRGARRYEELRARGADVDLQQTIDEVRVRDEQDATRAIAPLRPAADAVRIDTSGLAIDAVVDLLAARIDALRASRA